MNKNKTTSMYHTYFSKYCTSLYFFKCREKVRRYNNAVQASAHRVVIYEDLHLVAIEKFLTFCLLSLSAGDMEYIYWSRQLHTKPERLNKLIYINSNAKQNRFSSRAA